MNLDNKSSLHSTKSHPEHKTASPAAAKYDLEERRLQFASAVIDVSEKLPDRKAPKYIGGQFLRADTSPHGNHGEAQSAESRDDFIPKMKVCLKELREADRWARLIERKRWSADARLAFVPQEAQELIRIFKASLQTTEKNRAAKP